MPEPPLPLPLKSALCVCFWVSITMTTSYMKLPNINQEARIHCQMFGRQLSCEYYLTQNDGEWFLTSVNHEFFKANLKIDNWNNSYAITSYRVRSIFVSVSSIQAITGLRGDSKPCSSMMMRESTDCRFLTTRKTSAHKGPVTNVHLEEMFCSKQSHENEQMAAGFHNSLVNVL